MSANRNSIAPFLRAKLEDLQETIGITQFPDDVNWYQVIGGIIVQGGRVTVDTIATLTVPFNAPYEQQTLGVWIQVVDGTANTAYVTAVTLENFDIVNGTGVRDFYWLSLGV